MKHRSQIPLTWAAVAVSLALGCDPGGDDAGSGTAGEPSCSSGATIDACLGPPASEAAIAEVAGQISGRDLSQDPPRIASMRLFPVRADSQYARLEAKMGEELPRVLKFIWNDRVNTLRDDGQDGDLRAGDHVYGAFVDLEFVRRAGLMETTSPAVHGIPAEGMPLPAFKQRFAVRTANEPAGDTQNVVSALAGDNCTNSAGQSISCFVDQEKALLIRDLSVVNNSARTQDPCLSGTPGAANGVWMFGYLLNQMANTSKTGMTASKFALNWLDSWTGPKRTENALTVMSVKGSSYQGFTPQLPALLKAKWLQASKSTTTLAMNKAPFRLLAIVNRFDLRKNMFFGEGLAGELRFVFGVLNLNDALREGGPGKGACAVMDVPGDEEAGRQMHTVILEYAVDKADQNGVLAWAKKWLALSQNTLGSSTYLNNLQAITQSVVVAGVGGSKRANASALIRIRTNETGDDAIWDLREFAIDPNLHYPVVRTVKQTPMTMFNNSDRLGQWINDNKAAILNGTHNVPLYLPNTNQAFLGAHAPNDTNFTGSDPDFGFIGYWTPPAQYLTDADAYQARHLFSLNTCNGCHGRETKDPNFSPFFAHVRNRLYGARAQLSNFLTGLPSDPNQPQTDVYVPDPITGDLRYFNDLYSRNEDMANFLFWGPAAQVAFQPSTSTH